MNFKTHEHVFQFLKTAKKQKKIHKIFHNKFPFDFGTYGVLCTNKTSLVLPILYSFANNLMLFCVIVLFFIILCAIKNYVLQYYVLQYESYW